jgi:DNA repair protein RadC
VRAAETPSPTPANENCGCEPFTKVVKDVEKFNICVARANKIGPLTTPRRIYDLISQEIINKTHEEFYVLGIGAHGALEGKLVCYARVAQGGQHKVEIEVEQIAQVLLADRPDIYILVHGHPGDDAEPSESDIKLTDNLKAGLAKACPKIIFGDHLVIAQHSFYSFAEEKKFKV